MPAQRKVKDLTILYVEDDAITRKNVGEYLGSKCARVYVASDGEAGLEIYCKENPDIVITDIEMPGLNGLELAREIREKSFTTQIIIITAYVKSEYLLEAVNLQLVQYLVKPISLEKISYMLDLSSKYVRREITETRYILENGIHYNMYVKELFDRNRIIKLSKYERALIELLIIKFPAPASYDLINGQIYNFSASKNAIKLLVSSLREKVSKNAVINVSGFGYKLNILEKT